MARDGGTWCPLLLDMVGDLRNPVKEYFLWTSENTRWVCVDTNICSEAERGRKWKGFDEWVNEIRGFCAWRAGGKGRAGNLQKRARLA